MEQIIIRYSVDDTLTSSYKTELILQVNKTTRWNTGNRTFPDEFGRSLLPQFLVKKSL